MAEAVKLIHTADTHLRATQYARLDRGRDFAKGFDQVIDWAINKGALGILHSGDLIDTSRPTSEVVEQMSQAHQKMVKYQIWMKVISGNHDATKPHWSEVLPSDPNGFGIECVDNKRFEVEGLTVLGLPWMHEAQFHERMQEEDPADILLWHYPMQEFAKIGHMDSAMSIQDLPTNKFKAILMGDIHKRGVLELSDGTHVAMPGSTEMCKSDEPENKFCTYYEITPGEGVTCYEDLAIGTRPIVHASIKNEDQLEQTLLYLREVVENSDRPPMVFAKYATDVSGVFDRIAAVANPRECIIRCKAFVEETDAEIHTEAARNVKPSDFLGRFVTEGTPLFELGLQLLEPNADAPELAAKYVEEALK